MMRKTLFRLLLVFTFCLSPMLGLAANVQAQEPVSTPTPSLVLTQESIDTSSDPNVVTFEQFQLDEIQLTGPYDSFDFTFAIPADWRLMPGIQLNLSMGVSFDSTTLTQFDYPVVLGGGTLNVLLNGVLIDVLALNEVGEVEQSIQIPLDANITERLEERFDLGFVLDSSDLCYLDDQFNLFIHKNSHFVFPHELTQPGTNIDDFPRPIYQNSFNEDSALVIIPDQPSATDLQAALTVAASLGNLSRNTMNLDLATLGTLSPDMLANRHLIFVGKASSLPSLGTLNLPLSVSGNKFPTADGNADDDGVIQMIISPWSNTHVLLVASGNTDQGTIKAAQALTTSALRPNRFPNLAIVQEIEPTTILNSGSINLTMADLGYEDRVFTGVGLKSISYTFYVPPGLTASPDAYFELAFGHSAILNNDRSLITILLNSRPIGSVRMNEVSAGTAINRAKVDIPALAIRPGRNSITVRADLVPIDACTRQNADGLWLMIWSESSLLHLPLEPAFFNSASNLNLGEFPIPFSYDPTLGNTAFLLPRNDLGSWQSAMQIAALLGSASGGPITKLLVFYGDDFPEAEREKYNLLFVGRPSQLPIINDVNAALPAPFSQDNDMAAENNFQVTYRIPPDSPLGYVELISSPWNTENVVLAVVGNTGQGVSWAASSLFDPEISRQLAGNFAVVNDQKVLTTDTRYAASTTNDIATPYPEAEVPLSMGTTSAPVARPGWILPVLFITLAVITLIIALVVIGNRGRNRARRKSGKEL
jgi:hypothetical protein